MIGLDDWVWALPFMWEQGCVGHVSVFGLRLCVCDIGSGSGRVALCYVCVGILC